MTVTRTTSKSTAGRVRAYFASDTRRMIQTALGLTWLLDGALQLQPFMYSRGFIQQLTASAAGQPGWLATSIRSAAHLAQLDPAIWNTLFALTQVLLGVGLLYRRTVKPALAASFAWALVVWSVGEAFGMLFTDMPSPSTARPARSCFMRSSGCSGGPVTVPAGCWAWVALGGSGPLSGSPWEGCGCWARTAPRTRPMMRSRPLHLAQPGGLIYAGLAPGMPAPRWGALGTPPAKGAIAADGALQLDRLGAPRIQTGSRLVAAAGSDLAD